MREIAGCGNWRRSDRPCCLRWVAPANGRLVHTWVERIVLQSAGTDLLQLVFLAFTGLVPREIEP
jgi:hypothetical protein